MAKCKGWRGALIDSDGVHGNKVMDRVQAYAVVVHKIVCRVKEERRADVSMGGGRNATEKQRRGGERTIDERYQISKETAEAPV